MALLQVANLFISFGGLKALSGVNLSLEDNEILTVIGPNGSGKTTLFNCISGIYRPNAGEIIFNGENIVGVSPGRIAERGIARTFQNLRLFMHMDVVDNLMLGRHIRFRRNPLHAFLRMRREEIRHREVVEELIDFLDLQAYRRLLVGDCPYGVQKRVEIGRALATEPKLLLLDEPIAGLTSEEKEESAYRITEIRGRFKTAILLVEHDLRIASKLADRMIAFDLGLKIAEGRPEEVQRHPEVVRSYLGEG
jgi:branched-chain amino acid transport system ATP-binding protein|uniref:ABC transporter ATP-binding protein n=1 Tax=Desulfomonile tiedjei TaxID=2358 RepID=A0A7C4ARV9_9BACT